MRTRLNFGRMFHAGARPPVVNAFALTLAGLGLVALAAPLGDAEHPLQRVGVLLALARRVLKSCTASAGPTPPPCAAR